MTDSLSLEVLDRIDAYWRAANYLSAGQLYLLDISFAERAAIAQAHQEIIAPVIGARRPDRILSTLI